jgi:hypothetical protein
VTTGAAAGGAQLVVFGETFLAGFPVWNAVLPPIDQHEFQERLVAGPPSGAEGTRYGGLDPQCEVIAKQAQDIVGTRNRADAFGLSVDMRRRSILEPRGDGTDPAGESDYGRPWSRDRHRPNRPANSVSPSERSRSTWSAR